MRLVTARRVQELYDLLRKNPPFSSWRLPSSDKVRFEVKKLDDCFGEYEPDPHTIRISTVHCETLLSTLETIAHEICHLKLIQIKDPTYHQHGAAFEALAKQVCDVWGFDPKKF